MDKLKRNRFTAQPAHLPGLPSKPRAVPGKSAKSFNGFCSRPSRSGRFRDPYTQTKAQKCSGQCLRPVC